MHVWYINIYFTVTFHRHTHTPNTSSSSLASPLLWLRHNQHSTCIFTGPIFPYNVFYFLVHCVMSAARYRTATNTLLSYDYSFKYPVMVTICIETTNSRLRVWKLLPGYKIGVIQLTFRHRASCILRQAFHYSPENAFYIFNQQIYFIIWYFLDRASLI